MYVYFELHLKALLTYTITKLADSNKLWVFVL